MIDAYEAGVPLFEKANYANTISLMDEATLYAQYMTIFRDYMKPLLLSGDSEDEHGGGDAE